LTNSPFFKLFLYDKIWDACDAETACRQKADIWIAEMKPAVQIQPHEMSKYKDRSCSGRCAVSFRTGAFARALDKALGKRCRRAILDGDKPDRRGRGRHLDRQCLDARPMAAEACGRSWDESTCSSMSALGVKRT